MFHSGSGAFRHYRPDLSLLDFVANVCEIGNFTSMDIDDLLTSEGRFLVNELQTVFGMTHPVEQCVVDGKPGRMLYDEIEKTWRFEEGNFCRNHLRNLRVECVLKMLVANIVGSGTAGSNTLA